MLPRHPFRTNFSIWKSGAKKGVSAFLAVKSGLSMVFKLMLHKRLPWFSQVYLTMCILGVPYYKVPTKLNMKVKREEEFSGKSL